jgi:hypothetical protein
VTAIVAVTSAKQLIENIHHLLPNLALTRLPIITPSYRQHSCNVSGTGDIPAPKPMYIKELNRDSQYVSRAYFLVLALYTPNWRVKEFMACVVAKP